MPSGRRTTCTWSARALFRCISDDQRLLQGQSVAAGVVDDEDLEVVAGVVVPRTLQVVQAGGGSSPHAAGSS
jgi:hypothetical protein